ncbi:uncharacterized protein FOMMEDRAFT_137518 [Fomitiporia mediterranea MF3/22]|uniref:Uncharacterized protein n=1 Tax=Fomitiporia mediterranea (strain MF3/22) TaxID=694068 RepID=R7SHB6_FOMME|nr:uncharacterized protein FOMMEDRAFT_137518 [Fomitiporia mediterranea MF3/22]EJC97785.1 hypothetical protein FOMMEDRAFT_137518 [Fomitiporia mediterranea MF3/22]
MSHYTGHNTPTGPPPARVAFFGVTLFAAGYIGFYTFLKKRHERKHMLDRVSDTEARISSWETRMLQRATPVSSSSSPEALRAARIENRKTSLPPPTSMHDAHHRTLLSDASYTNGTRNLSQPTAQKGFSNGRTEVYTKNPGWREQAHYALPSKADGNGDGNGNGFFSGGAGYGEGEASAAGEFVDKVEEGAKEAKDSIKRVFGK